MNSHFTIDPVWPWSGPDWGLLALGIVAGLLTLMTLWTYLGVRDVGPRRLLIVLALRLGALLVICLLVLRPSLASEEEESRIPSKMIVLIDSSESMKVTDEFNNRSRWDNARQILAAPAVDELLKTLGRDERIEFVYYQGAEKLEPFNAEGEPTGKRTDIGTWLQELLQAHGREKNIRGLALFSDGANNGTRYAALDKASLWRGVSPLHAFALGKATTSSKLRDIALTQIFAEPHPVPVKGKLTVKGIVNAPGFENAAVNCSLWIEDPATKEDKLAAPVERVILKKTDGNEIALSCDAPAAPGELKVTLKIEPVPGEVTDVNNHISTYVTVTKDGLSILWVEGKIRAYEPVFALRYALSKDPRFRVYFAEKLSDEPNAQGSGDFYNFDKLHYDVVVIGDITAKRFSGDNPEVLERVREAVMKKGTGLLMLAGYDTFANKDWHLPPGRTVGDLLPVLLDEPGQFEGDVRMLPTKDGLNHYLLRLDDDPKENDRIWKEVLDPLDGMSFIGRPRNTATVLATGDNGKPLLVGSQVGAGRTLVFGGDTTWKSWRRGPKMLPAYQRFWQQLMLWLAQQENVEGNAWVEPDVRRVSAAGNERVGFSVGLRGPGGVQIQNAQFTVHVEGPDKQIVDVPIVREDNNFRGYFLKADKAGEYRITVKASGKDSEGKMTEGTASARFLAYAEDIENLRLAADHEFLGKLAQSGGGKLHFATESSFVQYLRELGAGSKHRVQPRVEHWPDWRRNPPSSSVGDQISTLWNSAALPAVLLFLTFISLEWFLRRRWGLV